MEYRALADLAPVRALSASIPNEINSKASGYYRIAVGEQDSIGCGFFGALRRALGCRASSEDRCGTAEMQSDQRIAELFVPGRTIWWGRGGTERNVKGE